jgi:plasmid stabilization system protein ParE
VELRVLDWVLASAVVALAAAVFAVSRRTARLQERRLRPPEPPGAVEQVREELEALRAQQARLADQLARCVQRVGMVRYDAFRDSGGRLSFSLALLDARGDGVVLSVLHGREGSYAYAKTLREGTSSHPLSEEEREAVRQAVSGGESGLERRDRG